MVKAVPLWLKIATVVFIALIVIVMLDNHDRTHA